MRFWDSSAIVPLLVHERSSARMLELLTIDDAIAAAFITPIEVESALWRRRHAGQIDANAHEIADWNFASISGSWFPISGIDEITSSSLRILARHPLRAGDAMQLAAALIVNGAIGPLDFVTLDHDLAAAARGEGFHVLT